MAETGMPFDPRRGRPWTLEIVGAEDLTPRMRRVHLTGSALEEFAPKPGQEMVLSLPQDSGEPARRHYTIRSYDPATRIIDIDVLLHGDTPGPRWARTAKAGDSIDAMGPRGRIVPAPAADWHYLSGDETGLPGIFSIIEALPASAKVHAVIEIDNAAEQQKLDAAASVELTWLDRHGAPADGSDRLIDALASFAFPAGNGHFYLTGETRVVRTQRQSLLARGIDGRSQIACEGYWRPGRVGGHDHVDHDEHGPMAGMRRP